MNETPIFVPWRDQQLAAVITVPDGHPRGLVALLTGVGAGRAHRFQVWTHTGRELARRGLASVRFDWLGIGDSSGEVDAWGWGDEDSLHDQASTVLDLAVRRTGITRTAAVGNCSGARISMLLGAEFPGCVGSACLLLPMVPSASQQHLRRSSARGVLSTVRRNAFVRRVILRRLRDRSGMDEVARTSIEKILARGRLLLLYGDDDRALTSRSQEQMQRLVASMPDGAAGRYELTVLPVTKMAGFDSLDTQRRTIEEVTRWLDELLPLDGTIAKAPMHRGPS